MIGEIPNVVRMMTTLDNLALLRKMHDEALVITDRLLKLRKERVARHGRKRGATKAGKR